MKRLILEPNVYELSDIELSNQDMYIQKHIEHFTNTLDFIKEYESICQLNFTTLQMSQLYNPTDYPWSKYKECYQQHFAIINLYKKLVSLPIQMYDASEYCKAIPYQAMSYYKSANSFDEFCKLVNLFCDNSLDSIIFFGLLNNFNIDSVCFKCKSHNYNSLAVYDCKNLFSTAIRELYYSKVDKKTIIPTLEHPLPQKNITKNFYGHLQELLISGHDKIEAHIEVGTQVALWNNYSFNEKVTELNSINNKIRKIFNSNTKPLIYLSIDLRHPEVEIYNCNGKHEDAFGYDERKKGKQDKTGKHDIVVK